MNFQFVINSAGIGQPDHIALRLSRSLAAAGGRLDSVFFHGDSAGVLQDPEKRRAWQKMVQPGTRLLICSAAWQRAGRGELDRPWEIIGWPVWFERMDDEARLVCFGDRP